MFPNLIISIYFLHTWVISVKKFLSFFSYLPFTLLNITQQENYSFLRGIFYTATNIKFRSIHVNFAGPKCFLDQQEHWHTTTVPERNNCRLMSLCDKGSINYKSGKVHSYFNIYYTQLPHPVDNVTTLIPDVTNTHSTYLTLSSIFT